MADFYDEEKGTFDISKVPDIYDSIKYDVLHNRVGDLNEHVRISSPYSLIMC